VALGADRRIAGDNAKLGVPEILLGVIPGGGGTQRLARLVGPAKAKDMVYTGRFVGADEALAIGLVDEVVAPDEVYNAALKWAGQFAGAASIALAAAKAAIDEGLDTDLDTGLKIEQHLFAGLFATEDRAIGMQSFIDNGPGKAQFTGK
jgi:enoyl-CoA hydratase